MSHAWSVDAAGVSILRRANRAGTGTASVTVHGASFGVSLITGMAREGRTGCEATEWESDTSVRCHVGQGARGTRRVVMTTAVLIGSVSHVWSMDGSGISEIRKGNRAGTGASSITVFGKGFGTVMYTGSARVGRSGVESTEWESDTSVRCLIGHGASGTRRVVVTAGERGGSLSQGWSVDLPGLSVMRRSNMLWTGSMSLTMHGASMGHASYTARTRHGQTGCEATEWESGTSVRCLTSHSSKGTRRLAMTVGAQSGSVSHAWSVDVTGMSTMRRGNGGSTGSSSVTVHGSGLGITAYTVRGHGGHTGCEGTDWESDTSVRCLVGRG